jgi:hypothetical protein
MKIKAVIHPAEEGGYWAEVPGLPGCITEGDSMEERGLGELERRDRRLASGGK